MTKTDNETKSLAEQCEAAEEAPAIADEQFLALEEELERARDRRTKDAGSWSASRGSHCCKTDLDRVLGKLHACRSAHPLGKILSQQMKRFLKDLATLALWIAFSFGVFAFIVGESTFLRAALNPFDPYPYHAAVGLSMAALMGAIGWFMLVWFRKLRTWLKKP
jgi:hypothetical protein